MEITEQMKLQETNFTTKKTKNCLSSQKSKFNKNPKSHVVHENRCSGCESTYVGQTCRHVIMEMKEQTQLPKPSCHEKRKPQLSRKIYTIGKKQS